MNEFVFSELEYIRPNFEHMGNVWKEATEIVKKATCIEEISEVIKKVDKEYRHVSTMMNIASIRNTLNTTDEFYDKESEFFDENGPIYASFENELAKALVSCKYQKDLSLLRFSKYKRR